MTNIEDIAVGDKVRLTRIIEGAVSNKDKQGVRIDNKWHDFAYYTTFEVVEKAKRQWKVGDTLGSGDFESLPVGTVVQYQSGRGVVLKTRCGYTTSTGVSAPTVNEFSDTGYVVVFAGESD